MIKSEPTSITISYQERHFNPVAYAVIPAYYGAFDADDQQLLFCCNTYEDCVEAIKKEFPDAEII